jgi:hypothetical protein
MLWPAVERYEMGGIGPAYSHAYMDFECNQGCADDFEKETKDLPPSS